MEKAYQVKVVGESESDWRGAIPDSIEALTKKPGKDTATLIYQAVKTQVELLCQKGDTLGALEAIEKYRREGHEYDSPLNRFKRDNQNGGAPYMGAHCFVGAFRDSAKFLFPGKVFYAKKGDKLPAQEHLRKFVVVRPNHIFLFRPDLEGEKISEPNAIEGQQPTPKVKGFAKYETIFHPFQFQFTMQINPRGIFSKFLGDKDKVIETLYQAALHGAGACRSAGYGAWRIVEAEIVK